MFGRKSNELIIPPQAKTDPDTVELLRVWSARGQQHVSIHAEAWNDPAVWGICLVDLARHVANFYSQEHGRDHLAVLKRIREGFDAEWGSPTSEATGAILYDDDKDA